MTWVPVSVRSDQGRVFGLLPGPIVHPIAQLGDTGRLIEGSQARTPRWSIPVVAATAACEHGEACLRWGGVETQGAPAHDRLGQTAVTGLVHQPEIKIPDALGRYGNPAVSATGCHGYAVFLVSRCCAHFVISGGNPRRIGWVGPAHGEAVGAHQSAGLSSTASGLPGGMGSMRTVSSSFGFVVAGMITAGENEGVLIRGRQG